MKPGNLLSLLLAITFSESYSQNCIISIAQRDTSICPGSQISLNAILSSRNSFCNIYKAALEDLHYYMECNLDKNQIMRFADCSFIDKAECILITGSTGVDKSYIASALGYHACGMEYKAVYYNVPQVFTKLKMSKADGAYKGNSKNRKPASADPG